MNLNKKILQLKSLYKYLNAVKTEVNDSAADSVEDTYGAARIEERINSHIKSFISPSSVETIAGNEDGTVAGLQSMFDGRVYHVEEVAGTPGFDIRLTFTGVTSLKGLGARFYYAGLTSHTVTFDLYNYVTDQWDEFILISSAQTHSYRYVEFPNGDNYISNGLVLGRFYHSSGGNSAHDIYIDFAGVAY